MFIRTLLLVGLCLVIDTVRTDDSLEFFRAEWSKFQGTHKRIFATALEQSHRFDVFVDNYRHVLQHNIDFRSGKHTFEIQMNLFGDQTQLEIGQQMNGFNHTLQAEEESVNASRLQVPPARHRRAARATNARSLPGTVDWRKKGAVGPVGSQGKCGSCWAFATAAAFESHYFIKHGKLPALSPQQLLDCSRAHGNNGCKGGVMRYAMDYVHNSGGMASSIAYPYVIAQRQCSLDKRNVLAMRGGSHRLTYGSESELMQAVANVGPVAVAIDASHRSFQLYKSGVYFEPACKRGFTDHAVLVVGYGTDPVTGAKYWLAKNSYGERWGESGYIRLARNRGNHCGVAYWGVYPIV